MKLQLMLAAAVLAVAGPAAAGEYGFGPNHPLSKRAQPERPRSYGIAPSPQQAPSATHRSNFQTVPEAPAYKPYTGHSVYEHPRGYGAAHGAKDCELSVYVNACDRR